MLTTVPPPDHTRQDGAPWGIKDAASYLGVSDRHIWRLIDEGKIKSIRLGTRRVMIPDQEIRRVAQEGTN